MHQSDFSRIENTSFETSSPVGLSDSHLRQAKAAVFHFSQAKEGKTPNVETNRTVVFKPTPAVQDIGTTLAVNFYKHLTSVNVSVPTFLSIGISAQLGPFTIGSGSPQKTAVARSLVVMEILRLSLIEKGSEFLTGEIANIATQYGLDADDLTNAVTRVSDKIQNNFTTSSAALLYDQLVNPDTRRALASFLSLPRVRSTDYAAAFSTLTEVHSLLTSSRPLEAVAAYIKAQAEAIPCFKAVLDLVTIRVSYGLPVVSISLYSMIDTLIGETLDPEVTEDRDLIDTLPLLKRFKMSEKHDSPAQFKFWELHASKLYHSIDMGDLLTTLAALDDALLGVTGNRIPIDQYMAFTIGGSTGWLLPEAPATGRNLIEDGTLDGIMTAHVIQNALGTNVSPFLATIKNGLSQYKVETNTASHRYLIATYLEALSAIASAGPALRSLVLSVIQDHHRYDKVVCSEPARQNTYSVLGTGISPVFKYAKGKAKSGDDHGHSLPFAAARSNSSDGKLSILRGFVIDKYLEIYQKAVDIQASSNVDLGSVRAVTHPSGIINTPPCFSMGSDFSAFVSPQRWYNTVEKGGKSMLTISSVPTMYLMGQKRVYATTPSTVPYADSESAAIYGGVFPDSLHHDTIGYISVDLSDKGAYDVSGLTSVIPLSWVDRLSQRADDAFARVVADMVFSWGKGLLNLSLSNLQTAMLLRNATLLSTERKTKFDRWADLAHLNDVTVPVQGITGTVETEFSSADMAMQMNPQPVIILATAGSPLYVQWASETRGAYATGYPMFAVDDFPHSSILFADAGVILGPGERFVDQTGPIISNEYGEFGMDPSAKPKNKNADPALVTNVGVGPLKGRGKGESQNETVPGGQGQTNQQVESGAAE